MQIYELLARKALIDVPEEMQPYLGAVLISISLVVALIGMFILSKLITASLLKLSKSESTHDRVKKHIGKPLKLLLVVSIFTIIYYYSSSLQNFHSDLDSVLYKILIDLMILFLAWTLIGSLELWERYGLNRAEEVGDSTQKIRYVTTQITVLKKLLSVIIILFAVVGALLITFDQLRQYGGAVFASAGVVSVILGFAAQPTLGNMFSGLQIALTGAIKIGDTVKIGTDWGVVEEITMTFVIIRLWSDRHQVIPCSYFTQNEFENWSIRNERLIDTVNLDLNWNVPITDLRKAFHTIVKSEHDWDKRTADLKVASAKNGWIRVQCVVSAGSISSLRDLQSSVRERMISWVQENATESIPETPLSTVSENAIIDADSN
ncbi:MAG: mechanosensitive ion channel family protein [Bifidobacteriaceae bacterium]|nr:mechanosensitive ion channel family protein [Bifidobacteriaceae bacterium]